MQELLPLFFGVLVGILVAAAPSVRARALIYPMASIVAGGLASFLNGELEEEGWAVLLSFDAALVWVAAALTAAAILSVRRLRVTA